MNLIRSAFIGTGGLALSFAIDLTILSAILFVFSLPGFMLMSIGGAMISFIIWLYDQRASKVTRL